jgi:hypothetical protein
MHYNVTIVELTISGHRYIIGAHRAAVEHMLQSQIESGRMNVVGDGTLRMPDAPLTLAGLAFDYDLDNARLAEAMEIDAAMHAQRIDDRLEWQKQEDEDFAQAEAETDHRRGFEWMNKP